MLEELFDQAQETLGVCAIQDAMVARQRHGHDSASDDLAAADDRRLAHSTRPDSCRVRWSDDWRHPRDSAGGDAEERERRAGELRRRQLALAGAPRARADLGVELCHGLAVGVEYGWKR